jgi:hypothetical protein
MPEKKSATVSRRYYVVIAVLICVHLGMGIHTAVCKTVTHDEIWHLPVGILNWQTAQFHHDDLNPPLTRMWAALPGWLFGPQIDEGNDATDIATKYVNGHQDYRQWYVVGRITNLLFSLATILITIKWSREWFGAGAGILTALLCCTEPNWLAHSSLVTPDAGLMFAFTATLYLLQRWRKQPTWKLALVLGVATGLAQATKFTAILLYAVIFIVGMLQLIWPHAARRRCLMQLLSILLISLLVWNTAFLFRGTGNLLSSYTFRSQAMLAIQNSLEVVSDVPVPLPESYMTGIDRQRSIMEQPHPVFLDREWSFSGFRSYFFRTMQYKLAHLLQILVCVGLAFLLVGKRHQRRADTMMVLGFPIILLTGIASMSSMQLGVRYVLPLLPCLILLTGPLAAAVEQRKAFVRRGLIGLICIVSVIPMLNHPHHLAYFNEAAGGATGGREHLLDSNIDWGQDLYLVRDFMESNDLDEIGLAYFGTMPPTTAGVSFFVPPSWKPEPGWYAVSVNFVMGRPHQIHQPDGKHRAVDFNEFGYFRQFEPVVTLGGSIDIYHITN